MGIYEIVTGITKESLSNYEKSVIPVRIQRLQELKPKQIENALRGFAQGCAKEDIEVFCDTGLFVNGKNGFLFSKEGIYGSDFNYLKKRNPVPLPIRYDDLSSVSISDTSDSRLCLYYKDGHTEEIYSSIFTGFLVTALKQILSYKNASDNPQKILEKVSKEDIATKPANIKIEKPKYSYQDALNLLNERLQNIEKYNHSEKSLAKIHYLYQAAKENNPAAMEFLAQCYAWGASIPQNYDKAIYWIEKGMKIAPEHLSTTAEQIKKEKALLCNNPYIPELGKIIYIDDKAHLVLSRQFITDRSLERDWEAFDRDWVEMFLRELDTGKPAILSVGWNPKDEKKVFISSYFSDLEPYGYRFEFSEQRHISGKYTDCLYDDYGCYLRDFSVELQGVDANIIYENLDCELRICSYEGNNTFRDLLNDKLYHIPISEIISNYEGDDIFESDEEDEFIHIPKSNKIVDLKALKPGAITEICLWQNKAYFAALMDCHTLDNLSDDNAVHLDWDSELVDIFIEQKSAEHKLAEFSFFDINASWVYPHNSSLYPYLYKAYSPLGCIIVKS